MRQETTPGALASFKVPVSTAQLAFGAAGEKPGTAKLKPEQPGVAWQADRHSAWLSARLVCSTLPSNAISARAGGVTGVAPWARVAASKLPASASHLRS